MGMQKGSENLDLDRIRYVVNRYASLRSVPGRERAQAHDDLRDYVKVYGPIYCDGVTWRYAPGDDSVVRGGKSHLSSSRAIAPQPAGAINNRAFGIPHSISRRAGDPVLIEDRTTFRGVKL